MTVALVAALAACGGHTAAPAPVPSAPERSPVRVRPPVVRIAIAEQVPVPELLAAEVPPPPVPPARPIPDDRRDAYDAPVAKPITAIQPWRREVVLDEGVTVVDLHPRIHRALLLTAGGHTWHLENPLPGSLLVDLDRSDATGLRLVHLADDAEQRCAPWTGDPPELVVDPKALPYRPICDGHLYVRSTVEGRRSTLEWGAAFVRSQPGGEHLTDLVKRVTRDLYRHDAELVAGDVPGDPAAAVGPAPVALLDPAGATAIGRGPLGLPIAAPAKLTPGAWVPVDGQPGVYATALAPRLVALPDDDDARKAVAVTDTTETGALLLMAAFDLAQLDVEFELGTEHPGVGWSPRAARSRVDGTPGPDGFATVAPLARTGMVSPVEAPALVAAFTGGFKREHGAFREGALSTVPGASHYGVVADGVIHSKLRPGLATLVVWDDARVDVVTWTDALDAELDRVVHARQNGVPLFDTVDGVPVVSPLIDNWREGNWSGSATGETRTIRAGACIQDGPRGRYLLYGYYTAARPRTLARVFLAAGCQTAIHLDMNALEHTYLAVYGPDRAAGWAVHHLDVGMAVLDKTDRTGRVLPRFVAFADNRDFFTLVRRAPRAR